MVGQRCTTLAGAVQTRHATSSGAVGLSENIRVETTTSPRASVTASNAQGQRCRSLGNDAQVRLAALLTAGALKIRNDDSPQKP